MIFCFFIVRDSIFFKTNISQSLKYFIIQILGSIIVLLSSLLDDSLFILFGVLLKIGA
jgi:hypothetical protein